MKWNIDISYSHCNYSVRLSHLYILWHNCVLNDTQIPAHSLSQKTYFVYLKNYTKLHIFMFIVYLVSKGLVIGKIVRLAADLYHNHISFIYIYSYHFQIFATSSLSVQYPPAVYWNSFIHPVKHLFTEHLIHARHSSSCLRYTLNETDENLCCLTEILPLPLLIHVRT